MLHCNPRIGAKHQSETGRSTDWDVSQILVAPLFEVSTVISRHRAVIYLGTFETDSGYHLNCLVGICILHLGDEIF